VKNEKTMTENMNTEVTNFLDQLNHPFRLEIEQLRNYILLANNNLTETIKWNGPNYSFNNEDRITMRVQPQSNQVQIIFHRGAKKQIQPKNKLIDNKTKLLTWKENDRATINFKSLQEIEESKAELQIIINEWLLATSQ